MPLSPDSLTALAEIEVATDTRLALESGHETFDAAPRRAESISHSAEAAVDWHAAVNGGSVLSFVDGVTSAEKSDVLYSTQLAQRAASAKHDRFAETEAWYTLYAEVMTTLGWVGESFALTERTSETGEFRMDASALDVIAAIATGGQLAILVAALDAMKGLAATDRAIRVFELQAALERSANFQLGAVQRSDNGALSLALGAFQFRARDERRGILFFRWGGNEVALWAAAQQLTFNRKHYDRLRARVIEKLGDAAADYLAELPVV